MKSYKIKEVVSCDYVMCANKDLYFFHDMKLEKRHVFCNYHGEQHEQEFSNLKKGDK